MKIEGDFTFDASRERVWEALLDPDGIAKVLPGCQKLEEIGENHYRGVMVIRIGPVQGQFTGHVKLSELKPPASYKIHVDGKGPTGFMQGQGVIALEETDVEDQTKLIHSIDAQVGGRIAAVGQRLMETSARSITRQSLQALNEQIVARESGAEPSKVSAPTATSMAAGVVKDVVGDVVKGLRGKKGD